MPCRLLGHNYIRRPSKICTFPLNTSLILTKLLSTNVDQNNLHYDWCVHSFYFPWRQMHCTLKKKKCLQNSQLCAQKKCENMSMAEWN